MSECTVCQSLPLAQRCGRDGRKTRWMDGDSAATSTCSVVSARGYHGLGRYPCSPNEERRAGCRATPLPPSFPPSQIQSQGSFGLEVTYRDGIPVKKLRRCRDTSALSLLQRCAHKLQQHLPATAAAESSGVQFTQALHPYFSLSASQCSYCSQYRRPPTTSDAQMHKNLTG